MRIPALFLFALPVLCQWPQWRGPHRDGISMDFEVPARGPKALTEKWSADVGVGYSSPVVSEGKVCVHGRDKRSEVVSCFDAASGRRLWADRYEAAFTKNPYAVKMSAGPFATPLISAGVLYTLGVNAVLTAYDLPSGKLRWRRQPQRIPLTTGMFCGTAASPLLDEGKLIVFWGDDRGGELLALEPDSGRVQWSYKGERPAYASPVVSTAGGVRQYVIVGQANVAGIAAATGKELWKVPFADEWLENIVTPIIAGDHVIVSGVRKNTQAFRISQKEDAWTAETVWTNADLPMYMSTPVLDGDYLYGLSSKRKGHVFCLDARTGKTLWTSEGRFAEQALIAATGRYLVLTASDGTLIVAERTPEKYVETARYTVTQGGLYAQAALAGRDIFIKDANRLRDFRLP